MKIFSLLALILSSFSSLASPDLKICTVLHENKSSHCVGSTTATYPTTKLFGISKTPKGQKVQPVEHKWNGSVPQDVISVNRGRIVISTFDVPAGFQGKVDFSISNTQGETLSSKVIEVHRGPLNITAQEFVEAAPPTAAVAATSPLEPLPAAAQDVALPEVNFGKKVETPVVLAVEKTPAPTLEPLPEVKVVRNIEPAPALKEENVSLPEVHFTESDPVITDSAPVQKIEKTSTPSGFFLKRFELHAAYLNQKDAGESFTAIPYWAPEVRTGAVLGFGARAGVTKWKSAHNSSFTAVEGDVHASFIHYENQNRLTLQPTLGYHSWGKWGSSPSYGLNLDLKFHSLPFSVVAGGHMWKRKEIQHRLATLGFGFEF